MKSTGLQELQQDSQQKLLRVREAWKPGGEHGLSLEAESEPFHAGFKSDTR